MAAKKTARRSRAGSGSGSARSAAAATVKAKAKASAATNPKGGPRTPASATHHAVRRKQHESEAAQDYCEAIAEMLDDGVEARVGRIAERFGLSHVTVSRVVRRLAAAGFVEARPHRPLGLTARGRALAAEAKERHETVVDFLRKLGVDEATAQADAEGIEHHVSPATLRAMRRFRGA